MLLLRPEDFAEGLRPGVTIWQRKRTPTSSPDVIYAWEDLLLVRPQLRLPEGCEPRSERSWRDGVRIAWSNRLHRYLYMSPVPVSDLLPAEELGLDAGSPIHFRSGSKKTEPLQVVSRDEKVLARLSRVTGARLELACGDLRWRFVDVMGRPTLLGWGPRSKLRALAVPILG